VPDADDLEARVTTLEHQVARLREEVATTRSDAAAARVLAGGADRDVAAFGAKLDAHTKVLNALRETQVEHGQRLDSLERVVEEGFAEMRHGFSTLNVGMAQITALLKGTADRDPE
jgi:hypothetical protein